jgi:type VI secretion system secreted protein VgrG
MTNTASRTLRQALNVFSSTTRLYELVLGDDSAASAETGFLVEAFAADDALDGIGARDVIVLSTSAHLTLESLLGQRGRLEISLADGTRTRFAGDISEVAMLGSDGGFARYRVRLSPWLWRLGQVRNSRVWQDKTVLEIVDTVFAAYQPLARWRWTDETRPFMADAATRGYCCQYRESDFDFVRRLLAEEGLSWRFEQSAEGPEMVLFADSSQVRAVPDDPSSELHGGIRFHGVSAVERQDTVQALVAQRSLQASLATVLSPNYKSKQVSAASSPSMVRHPSRLPQLESYDVPGQFAYANRKDAERYADLYMEGQDARALLWHGRSTVRTLRAGTRMIVTGAPRKGLGNSAPLTILRVTSIGVNNLPPPARDALAELFGPIPQLLEQIALHHPTVDLAQAMSQAIESGYANCFEAVPAEVPWRPHLPGSAGLRHAKPTAFGAQSAVVIGPDGLDTPRGADELYCDRLGRVRIRFHWQDSGDASCWVRVAQRSAGGGMGFQFLPRIGQEVLVQFLENDIDRPIIVGALYNGRGEGGIVPTPGGRVDSASDTDVFGRAHDHCISAQGNLAGGNSPVWHGASGDSAGHRNGGAQWGIRSKEFGGSGYNQLLFDDTDAQGRVQLKCSHAATELNLGHLIHPADNYRGSFRGSGAELRTDAYGAVRAGGGLLVSSYRLEHSAARRDPAGENAAGAGLLQQAVKLAQAFDAAAVTHQTVGLAAHLGAAEANASVLDAAAAPLAAIAKAVAGRVDKYSGAPAADTDALPHLSAPIIVLSAKDGFGASAAQSLQLVNGETATLMSGQDTQFVVGGQMRVHTMQAIGVLGGAVKADIGLQLIAAKDAIDIQAQSDELKVQARDEINVISANAHIDWAAAKRISLSTAGGANITIEGGNITVQCPGKIKVHAGKKSFVAPARLDYPLPSLPTSICVECLLKARSAGSPFVMRSE